MIPRPKPAALLVFAAVAIAVVAATAVAGARQGSPQGRPAQAAAPAAPQRGTSSITVTVVTDEGAAVKNARVFAVAVPVAQAGQATPGAQPAAQTRPMVIVGSSGAPLTPDATQAIQLAVRDGGRTNVVQRQARTNASGVAVLTDLPAGTYSVNAGSPTGYVGRDTNARVQVGAGATAGVTLKMSRGGVITGRVFDDEGDPVTGAWVSVFRATRGGRAQVFSSSAQSTNDLGIYRVWNLPAGDYFVSTNFDERQGGGGPEDRETAPVDGYLPSYFPGVAAFDAARSVQVRAGQETGGVDIPLIRGRLGSVVARVVDSVGNALGPGGASGAAYLVARGRNPAFNMRGGAMRQDGSLLIPNVPAGEYYLSAMVTRGAGPSAIREGAYVPVTVNGDEVTVSLQTNTGASVSGRIVIEGTPPAQSGSPGGAARSQAVRVSARSGTDGAFASAFSTGESGPNTSPNAGTARPDGTFSLAGLRGPIQITATHARAALKAVRRGGADISGHPLELAGTERVDDLVVVMTYDTGGIEGTVVGEDDEPLAGAAVFVAPDDPDRWQAGSPFMRLTQVRGAAPGAAPAPLSAVPGVGTVGQATPGGEGFQMIGLPAGRYLVVGLPDAATVGAPDRQLIEQWRAEGKTVTVDVGQTARVRVKAIR
jgi:hypothetical protein